MRITPEEARRLSRLSSVPTQDDYDLIFKAIREAAGRGFNTAVVPISLPKLSAMMDAFGSLGYDLTVLPITEADQVDLRIVW